MIYTILGKDKEVFTKQLKRYKLACILSSAIAIAINVLLLFVRTPATHNLFLIINVLLDVAVGWFVLFAITGKIKPNASLLALYNSKGNTYRGEITAVSQKTCRFKNMDCLQVTVGHQNPRTFFLPYQQDVSLPVGQMVTIIATANVITEVRS